ncbi:RraA family protein [Pseudonocardia sp. TRM90224]|uniref:RraA family protein n=1 Tax=Pseudonocardia sp. TRM90224 TaxID=2812678 RepID=UPI001E489DE3|nr:RraA family protein [Pseudonocardia sp. TRM90224]
MEQDEIEQRFAALTTAHIADGCVRTQVPVRCAPAEVRAVVPGTRVAGRAAPARHVGSVDIFLEVITPGAVLVVDNAGRVDESCVGDLMVLEAQAGGMAGIVIWGLNRDTAEIQEIGLPVFSAGSLPTGPLRLDERPTDATTAARFGEWTVTSSDVVLGDEDGVLFVPADRLPDVLSVAETIRDTERRQADLIRSGTSLRSQVRFGTYLTARASEPTLTFREHLRRVGGAIEV